MDYPAKIAYQDRQEAQTYERQRFKSLKGRLADHLEKRAIGKLLKNLSPESLILDVACGTGRITRYLWQSGFQAWGVDISGQMLEVARQNLRDEYQQARFFRAEAEKLPFASGQFEAATAIKLMGHVPPEKRIQILKEMSRVSCRAVIVAYYFSSPVHNLKRRIKKFLKGDRSPWYPVTWTSLAQEISAAGLKISEYLAPAGFFSETRILCLRKNEDLDAG